MVGGYAVLAMTMSLFWMVASRHGLESEGRKSNKVVEGTKFFTVATERSTLIGGFGRDERARYCASLTDVREARQTGTPQIIDARGQARFQGQEQEPRAGLACGHIPTSLNVPYTCVCDDNGRMLPDTQLRDVFEEQGVDVSKPTITSCGSGITACVLAFALHPLRQPASASL